MKWCVLMLGPVLAGYVICRRKKNTTWSEVFLVCGLACVLGLLAGYAGTKENLLSEEGYLIRGKAGEGDYETELILQVDGTNENVFTIVVPEQTLTAAEEEAYLEAALSEIENEIKGTNLSLDEIRTPLLIHPSYQNELVTAEWSFSETGIFDDSGNVIAEKGLKQAIPVVASVELQCGKSCLEHSFYLIVYSEELSEDERLERAIRDAIISNGNMDGTGILMLPAEADGHSLAWSVKESNLPIQVMALGMVVAFLLPELKKEREREEKKKREEQLLREYPNLVNKLTLLLGAGMTIQGAWKRITEMYLTARTKKLISKKELYEEMLITRYEIESGRGEVQAFEAFGERCGAQRYRKFSGFFVQNLRKGSNSLCDILEKEMLDLFAEKRNTAKRYGEEATTKMLFPMLLMLGIVIFIIMVPAVISFQTGV